MKKLILFSFIFSMMATFSFAQHGSDDGKTYYDDAHTKLKEVYSYKEVNTFNPNDPEMKMETVTKKHGPYFYYYESGKLKISGNYKDDKKHGEWKYYDEEGNITKVETYKNGELIDTEEKSQ